MYVSQFLTPILVRHFTRPGDMNGQEIKVPGGIGIRLIYYLPFIIQALFTVAHSHQSIVSILFTVFVFMAVNR